MIAIIAVPLAIPIFQSRLERASSRDRKGRYGFWTDSDAVRVAVYEAYIQTEASQKTMNTIRREVSFGVVWKPGTDFQYHVYISKA